ncbi:tetratricopeptide repeat-containing sulfotransferase family protein [Pararhizobium sp. IMCC21322]|uniref:tetratricopeptide repeat-containing sulfotransferase family protein n=1 Tax=Pararhizobium sp. IMCC21322 TaxID=3067903 RepID=UPI0027413B31|nr:tetratricopeptide repeat-containing sulfotransferase family protein [Pararhizobium sp. IMCC21322]
MNRAEKRRLAKQAQATQAAPSATMPVRRNKRNGVYRTKGDPQQLMAMLEAAHKIYAVGQPEQAKLAYHAILQLDSSFPDANNSLGIIDVEAGKHDLAERWFEKAAKAEPTRPTFHNNRGLALLELKRNKEAVDCFKASLDADPEFVPAMVNLGKGYNAMGEYKEAIPVLKKAVSITPDFLDAYTELASAYGEMGQIDEAISSLDEALKVRPTAGRLLNQKAGLLTIFGRLEEAEAIHRKILDHEPDNINSYNAIARTKKFETYDDDMKNMERLYKTIPDVDYSKVLQGEVEKEGHEDPKMNLAMALAKAFEAIKEYEKSFFYYKEGNRLRRKKYFYNQADDFREFDLHRQLFTPALLAEFKGAGHQDKTPIFIVGMPRSGTTLLEQVFHSHRDVFGAGELAFMPQLVREEFKNMRIFENKLKAGKVTNETFRGIGAAYLEKVREIETDSPFITDKMPHNFLRVGFIKLALPNAKIIHSNRNPIDNAFAIFKQIFGNDGHPYAYDLVELGQYHNKFRELMAHWDSIFPGQILENRYEDMVADLEKQTRTVLDFCGLDWDPNCLNFHEADRAIRTASVTQVRQPIYKSSVEKWRKYEAQLQPLIRVLEKGLPF